MRFREFKVESIPFPKEGYNNSQRTREVWKGV